MGESNEMDICKFMVSKFEFRGSEKKFIIIVVYSWFFCFLDMYFIY